MMFYVCLFVVAVQSVQGGVRQVILPGGSVKDNVACDTICDDETHELHVCGSDGIEYKTRCEFNNAVCAASKGGDKMYMVNYGPCVTLNSSCTDALQARCVHTSSAYYMKNDDSSAICGSDKRTYSTACSFRHAQCLQQQQMTATQLSVDHMGKCSVDTTNQIEVDCSSYFQGSSSTGIAIESGNIVPHATCDKVYDPVCGAISSLFSALGTTYTRTFGNECSLCQYLMTSHQLTKDNMIGHMVSQGACPHNIIG